MVICHLAQPTPAADADPVIWAVWEEQVGLNCLPNVWFDIAVLPAYVQHEGYSYPNAGWYLRIAIGRIGPSKIMCGSNLPVVFGFGEILPFN